MLATKFRTRSPSPSPDSRTRVPEPTVSATAKEARDAALRARGLLPPLRDNRDHSRQEFEQDQNIPIVTLTATPSTAAVSEPSAADLIKREWESKHGPGKTNTGQSNDENAQRERLKTFKFGGALQPLTEMEKGSTAAPAVSVPSGLLTPVAEVDTPLASPIPEDSEDVARSDLATTASTSSPNPGRTAISDLVSPSGTVSTPPPPVLEFNGQERTLQRGHVLSPSGTSTSLLVVLQTPDAEPPSPRLIPLPPSPLPSLRDVPLELDDEHADLFVATKAIPTYPPAPARLHSPSPSEIPLPPSPSPSHILLAFDDPGSVRSDVLVVQTASMSGGSLSVAGMPSILSQDTSRVTPIRIPTLSLSPPIALETGDNPSQILDSNNSPALTSPTSGTEESSAESESVLLTPSLDHSSHTLSISTVGTSEFGGHSKLRTKIATNDALLNGVGTIPMIVESPIEDISFGDFIPSTLALGPRPDLDLKADLKNSEKKPNSTTSTSEPTENAHPSAPVRKSSELVEDQGHHSEQGKNRGSEDLYPRTTKTGITPTIVPLDHLSSSTKPEQQKSIQIQSPLSPPPTVPKRGLTDSNVGSPRPVSGFKSLVGFGRRGQTTDSAFLGANQAGLAPPTADPSLDAPSPSTRRLTLVKSLTNIRRSFVETLSKPKRGPKTNLRVNIDKPDIASNGNTPLSPISPGVIPLSPAPTGTTNLSRPHSPSPSGAPSSTSFNSLKNRSSAIFARARAMSGSRSPSRSPLSNVHEQPMVRQPLSPTYYTRGFILQEMNGIEDEESRRVTELAFLG